MPGGPERTEASHTAHGGQPTEGIRRVEARPHREKSASRSASTKVDGYGDICDMPLDAAVENRDSTQRGGSKDRGKKEERDEAARSRSSSEAGSIVGAEFEVAKRISVGDGEEPGRHDTRRAALGSLRNPLRARESYPGTKIGNMEELSAEEGRNGAQDCGKYLILRVGNEKTKDEVEMDIPLMRAESKVAPSARKSVTDYHIVRLRSGGAIDSCALPRARSSSPERQRRSVTDCAHGGTEGRRQRGKQANQRRGMDDVRREQVHSRGPKNSAVNPETRLKECGRERYHFEVSHPPRPIFEISSSNRPVTGHRPGELIEIVQYWI
ncbi:hypothetical protein C8R45DRAFT_937251 [Mycena sanguinolenta]|nr:hypothetical protein C8R45DRAFT_937251 [Mycena sanguinolenta]